MTEEELDAAVDVIAAVGRGGSAIAESAGQAKEQAITAETSRLQPDYEAEGQP
jgi:hypothetical protein